MTAVDRISIQVKSGHGGQGASSFRREKYVPKGGPDGGDGGNGGNVILKATHRIQTLGDFSSSRVYSAKAGENGKGKNQFGLTGIDLILDVPIGTLVFDDSHELLVDLCLEGQEFVVAKGGKGGKGNAKFSNSINRAPRYAQPGMPGEEKEITLELRLIAEVGIVGLPNAGKSTLLQTLTQASPKIGNYPFTTLFPNLGTLKFYDQEIVLADIPGLIEGSADGLGLGHDFLRHIDRTRFLVHLVEVKLDPQDCLEDYNVILSELKLSPYELLKKTRIVVLSKIETIESDLLQETIALFKKKKIHVLCISSFSKEGIQELIETIYKLHHQIGHEEVTA